MKNFSFLLCLFFLSTARVAFAAGDLAPESLPAGQNLYVIERNIPGVGQWTPEQLKAASEKSCQVLSALGPKVQWLHSYVTGDKLYCIYVAPSVEAVKEHATRGGFPANTVNRVSTIISPDTAFAPAAKSTTH